MKKDKSEKIIEKLSSMSDEEFLNCYKEYYAYSTVRVVVGILLFILVVAMMCNII